MWSSNHFSTSSCFPPFSGSRFFRVRVQVLEVATNNPCLLTWTIYSISIKFIPYEFSINLIHFIHMIPYTSNLIQFSISKFIRIRFNSIFQFHIYKFISIPRITYSSKHLFTGEQVTNLLIIFYWTLNKNETRIWIFFLLCFS